MRRATRQAGMSWMAVDEALPAPDDVVYRYGPGVVLVTGHTFPSRIDRGKLVTAEGSRYADWGVTHWMRVPVVGRQEQD